MGQLCGVDTWKDNAARRITWLPTFLETDPTVQWVSRAMKFNYNLVRKHPPNTLVSTN